MVNIRKEINYLAYEYHFIIENNKIFFCDIEFQGLKVIRDTQNEKEAFIEKGYYLERFLRDLEDEYDPLDLNVKDNIKNINKYKKINKKIYKSINRYEVQIDDLKRNNKKKSKNKNEKLYNEIDNLINDDNEMNYEIRILTNNIKEEKDKKVNNNKKINICKLKEKIKNILDRKENENIKGLLITQKINNSDEDTFSVKIIY